MEQSIEIDCAPMTPRPDSYIKGVLEGTGIEESEGRIVSKFFGNWKWDFSSVDRVVWDNAQTVIAKRIKDLHDNGNIRYGSW